FSSAAYPNRDSCTSDRREVPLSHVVAIDGHSARTDIPPRRRRNTQMPNRSGTKSAGAGRWSTDVHWTLGGRYASCCRIQPYPMEFLMTPGKVTIIIEA